jgi:hypothetical protein
VKVPNGARAYQDIGFAPAANRSTLTVNSVSLNVTGEDTNVSITNTGFKINFAWADYGSVTAKLVDPSTGALITDPALVIFEEKDDNNRYEGLIVTTEVGGTATDGIGVSDVVRTWESDQKWDSIALASDSKKLQEADLWGTIITLDNGDSDQNSATISYPDEQVYAQLYVGKTDSSVTAGTTTGGTVTELGSVLVKDSEVSSVATKNLIVVGGSCINTVAAKILGSDVPLCGDAFTEKAAVGASQALVKVVTSPYATDKVAMLVAGYEAADTTKAVKYITTEKPVTDKDTSVKLSTSATVATVVTEAATPVAPVTA